MLRSIVIATVLIVAAMQPALAAVPGAEWETATPAEVGLDREGLEAFAQQIGGRGCVVRGGKLVYTWGDATKPGDVASAAKTIYAHFLWVALADGRLKSLDEHVLDYEPRLASLNADLGDKDRKITFRHLVTQTSCYGVAEQPGTAFSYNDFQMALFWDTLFHRIYGVRNETVDAEVLRPMLTDRIGCQDSPTMMAFGLKDRPGRLAISPRDFARFGLLYLHKGKRGDEQLLPAELVEKATTSPLSNDIPRAGFVAAEMIPGQRTIGSNRIPDNQTDHLGSYSFLWWTNGVDREGRRHWPDVPEDAFAALGHGGKRAMVVVPSRDIIVSWNDTNIDGRDDENAALRVVVAAVTDE
jgi:CubicO group peptidase (beta-lactamase class C family)